MESEIDKVASVVNYLKKGRHKENTFFEHIFGHVPFIDYCSLFSCDLASISGFRFWTRNSQKKCGIHISSLVNRGEYT